LNFDMIPNVLAVTKATVTRTSSTAGDAPTDASQATSEEATDQSFSLVLGQRIALVVGAEKVLTSGKDEAPATADASAIFAADTSTSSAILAASAFFAAQPPVNTVIAKEAARPQTSILGEERPSAVLAASDRVAAGDAANIATTESVEVQTPLGEFKLPSEGRIATPVISAEETVAAAITKTVDSANPLAVPTTSVQTQRIDSAAHQVRVEPTVGETGWRESFTDKVAWIVHQGRQVADLQLNPPQLGPLEVRVVLGADQASISFTSPNAVVREAIQAALPRLSEILQEQGVMLSDVSVATHSFSQQQSDSQNARQAFGETPAEARRAVAQVVEAVLPRPSMRLGLVDLFA
jgi:flagellar hook-length control protein FliK